jgi:class 3 adenylate cyclase/tetratricopeptide (TPR) repeat protein
MHGSTSCTECGHAVSETARFCERCGAALRPGVQPLRAPDHLAQRIAGQRSAIEGERKQVTVMFTDIVRSMELTRSLETERWGVVLDSFLAIACGAIHKFEGTVNQFTGDGLMAVFGAPIAHEDHARRACLATLELQRRLKPFAAEVAGQDGVEFRIRCGLNSGEVIVGEIGDDLHMDFAPIGNTSGMGKRMESLAPVGSTAISASTAALVEGQFELRELGEFEVKGATEPQRVFELLGPGAAHSRLEAVAAARGLSRFVGRDTEQGGLMAALERALAGEGRVVGIVGEPGVGKSRLCREFVRHCRERGLQITSGAALAHGRNVPLLPVLAMFRDFFGIGERDEPSQARTLIETALIELDATFDADLPLIFDFLGVPDLARPTERIDPEARQRQLLRFLGRLVEARSRRNPAVIVLEDLHWIDEASAAFLEELVGAVPTTRTLLVATFRPEYEAHWMQSSAFERHELDPLDDEATGELLEELVGGDPSLEELAELIRDRTGGNPFFIEEIVRALAETGRLTGEAGSYRLARKLEEMVLPPTVQAVLAARIDRLPRRDKDVLQKMSVIGREVPEPVLREVTELPGAELADSLCELEAGGFLTEAQTNAHREFTFKHPLTQEVAYSSQLSAARSSAHAAVGEAIERLYPDGLEERAALLAHHAEAAGDMLKAAQWHSRAAAWISVSSPAEGMRHWRRVRELTGELASSPEVEQLAVLARISILALAWRLGMSPEATDSIHAEGMNLLVRGDPGHEMSPAVEEDKVSADGHRTTQEASGIRVLLDLAYGANLFTKGREREAVEITRGVASRVTGTDDPGLLVNIAAGGSFPMYLLGNLSEARELTDRALLAAGEDLQCGAGLLFGDAYAFCLEQRGLVTAFMGNVERGLRDIDRAIELARAHNDPEVEAYVRDLRIMVGALIGDFEDADRHAERIAELSEKLGTTTTLVLRAVTLARLARGEFGDAEEEAARALELVRERQVRLDAVPLFLTWLSQARLGLGKLEDALSDAEQAAAIARERGLRILEIFAQLALSRALREKGGSAAHERGEAAASRALQLATATGARATEPQIHAELAGLARLRGDEAAAQREEAEVERILTEITATSADDAEQEVQRLALDMLQAASHLFGGRETEGAETLKSGYRRLLALERPNLVLEASSAAAYACWVTGSPAEGVELVDLALEQADDAVLAAPGLAVKSPHAQARWVRALCAGSIGRSTVALRDLDRSRQLAREHGDSECEGFTHECRSRILLDMGEVDAARAEAERAVEVAIGAGNNQALASALASVAAIRNELGDFSAGREAAAQGLEIVREKTAGLLWEPDLLAAIAVAELGLGDVEPAQSAAENAVRRAGRRALRRGEILGQLALARVLAAKRGMDAAEPIEASLQRALELATACSYRSIEPRIRLELAALARLRSDEETAQREDARARQILAEMTASDAAHAAS